jgi:hypothetical protein
MDPVTTAVTETAALSPIAQMLGLGASSATASAPTSAMDVVIAIGLTFLLTAFISAVYRTIHQGPRYSQDYVHNLMLLGMVVSVIILVVSTKVETAFAVFAAFSIIRFRRAVPQAIDVGFIFFAMAIGMAVGAQQHQMAIISTLLVSLAILLVSTLDLFAPERPSHHLRIRVTPDIDYERDFAEPFAEHLDRIVLVSVESVQAGLMTELRYAVRLSENGSPQELVRELQKRNGNNRVLLKTESPTFEGD